ncbi:head-to-tail adaptor [Nocardia phage NS-I]|jgi:hypothetical protein|nr:head-to-tail adaptor [Nocardia phage NS-I]
MERVIRVRGGGRDENDDPIPPEPDKALMASAVAPGSSPGNKDRGRNGERVAYTVLFHTVPDLREGDQLRVRGKLMDTVILDWRSPYTNRKGLEVLCSAGEG